MINVKVKVFGAHSLEVQAESAKEVYDIIDMHLAMDKKLEVRKIRKGRQPKVSSEEKTA